MSSVTEENLTSVNVYLPTDTFYDFETLKEVSGKGASGGWAYDKGGEGKELRGFGCAWDDGLASGSLYVDDGENIDVGASTCVSFAYKSGKLDMKGTFRYVLGVKVNGKKANNARVVYDEEAKV
ncbi:hypothetical protein BDQ17DRAFT_1428463 [Cyathus striatus]|nr:hypothetical protein BDQ17DRAFT_1428463 [Cyathus striatus]